MCFQVLNANRAMKVVQELRSGELNVFNDGGVKLDRLSITFSPFLRRRVASIKRKIFLSTRRGILCVLGLGLGSRLKNDDVFNPSCAVKSLNSSRELESDETGRTSTRDVLVSKVQVQ